MQQILMALPVGKGPPSPYLPPLFSPICLFLVTWSKRIDCLPRRKTNKQKSQSNHNTVPFLAFKKHFLVSVTNDVDF